MHLTMTLPDGIAPGDNRDIELDIEVIPMNNGQEHRNQQWESPKRTFEVSYPPMPKTSDTMKAILAVWEATEFGLHTFNHVDPLTDELVRVRFEGKLSTPHVAGPLYRVETIVLVEVDDEEDE